MKTGLPITKQVLFLTGATMLLLMIPTVAMQFTDEVNWTLTDFIVAGILLFGTGLAYILVTRILAQKMAANLFYRLGVGLALFTGLFLIWVNLAVGIIGSENNPFNTVYFSVLAVGLIGVFAARFRPKGMFWALLAAAIAQTMVAVSALILGEHHSTVSSVSEILGVNGMFVTLWIVSALMFRYAGMEPKQRAFE